MNVVSRWNEWNRGPYEYTYRRTKDKKQTDLPFDNGHGRSELAVYCLLLV